MMKTNSFSYFLLAIFCFYESSATNCKSNKRCRNKLFPKRTPKVILLKIKKIEKTGIFGTPSLYGGEEVGNLEKLLKEGGMTFLLRKGSYI